MVYFGRLLEEEVAALFQPKWYIIKLLSIMQDIPSTSKGEGETAKHQNDMEGVREGRGLKITDSLLVI